MIWDQTQNIHDIIPKPEPLSYHWPWVFNHASNNHKHTGWQHVKSFCAVDDQWYHVIPERGIFLCLIMFACFIFIYVLALVSEKISTASQPVLTFSKIPAIKGQRSQYEFKYFSVNKSTLMLYSFELFMYVNNCLICLFFISPDTLKVKFIIKWELSHHLLILVSSQKWSWQMWLKKHGLYFIFAFFINLDFSQETQGKVRIFIK